MQRRLGAISIVHRNQVNVFLGRNAMHTIIHVA